MNNGQPNYASEHASTSEGQTRVQKGVLAIGVTLVIFWIFPPAGLALGALLGVYQARQAMSRMEQRRIERRHEAVRQWRASPWNQQFMTGVADNGGLSIEERNAYRRSANESSRRAANNKKR